MQKMCGAFSCWATYIAKDQYTSCPSCDVAEADMIRFRTNNPRVIKLKKLDALLDILYNDALGG